MAGMEGFYRSQRQEQSLEGSARPSGHPAGAWPQLPRRTLVQPPGARRPVGDQREPPHGAASRLQADPPGVSGDRYAGLGFGLVGLASDCLASHPMLVLRRQCQVNHAAARRHRTPFTLLPVVVSLQRTQGVSCLWKGLGSALTVRGLTLAAEDLTSKLTPWPKEVDAQSSPRHIGQHLLLKAVSLAAVMPFHSASLVESVQSEIASERPGVLDVFKEGLARVLVWGVPVSGRALPVWILLPATVLHGLAHYVTSTVTAALAMAAMCSRQKRLERSKGAVIREGCSGQPGGLQYRQQVSVLVGRAMADILLFPIETVLTRLHVQGCRAIVDNLDSGREVVPIMTRYEGFFDCLSTIMEEEGVSGLFKGFGALVAHYALQYALLRASAAVIVEISRAADQHEGVDLGGHQEIIPPSTSPTGAFRMDEEGDRQPLRPSTSTPSLISPTRRRLVAPEPTSEN